MLRDAALAAGATLRTLCPVSRVDARGPAVVLDSGERVRADIIIGADGVEGVTRRSMGGGDADFEGIMDTRLVFNFTLPLDAVRREPELRQLADSRNVRISLMIVA
jgi:salicylate hydroxylase